MAAADGVGGVEGREFVSEGFQGAAEAVVGCVVGRLLDVVAAADCGLAVVVVGFVGDEVDFSEEFLFVVF